MTDLLQGASRRHLAASLLQTRQALRCLALALGLAAMLPASAQPSGGPYGPVAQSYALPKAGHVFVVAPDGKADAAGTVAAPTTLEAAVTRVVTGDAIVLRGGTYRTGSLKFNQGITLQPYLDEQPVLKGTQLATTWEALPQNVWRTKWSQLFPAQPLGWWQRKTEGKLTPLHRFNNDMVFVDGELLESAGWEGELGPKTYYIDYANGYVYLGFDPKGRQVEITAHDVALHRTTRETHGKAPDKKGPQIRGLSFTQYAYRAIDIEGQRPAAGPNEEPTDDPIGISPESAHGKEVVGTLLENVSISFCSRVAGYFRGDKLVIRNSLISDTGTEGIYVIGSSDVLLERNLIRRNNVERLTGIFPSAVKIFNQSYRVTVRDNLIIEQPHSNAVWYDVGNVEGVFVNNHIEGAQAGLFFEISKGVVVAGNVFVNNEVGIRILNSSGARVYHNTFVNSPALFARDPRSNIGDHFGWHPTTGPGVDERVGHVFESNLMVADNAPVAGRWSPPRLALLRFEQPPMLCGKVTAPMSSKVDGNVYVRMGAAEAANRPLVSWASVADANCMSFFDTLDDFRKAVPGVEAKARVFINHSGAVFRSPEMRRFEPVGLLAGVPAQPVPAEARKVLGWPDVPHVPGAYPASR
ncbi:right-handed parallel beta-helix repeat-containing protein [Roseateles paludis]|uniref:Right-handed parallel beta-helix repeat-containing protein n=1 Tax=Roseateles paludis TaxID=3145238 RepID=A0ABV0G7U8_9BURK